MPDGPSQSEDSNNVAVIGTGRMGQALSRALHTAGYKVTVWNRTVDRTVALARDGIQVAGSLVEAVDQATTVIVCVLDYPASNSLLFDERVEAGLAGKTLVQLTTGSPVEARATARWAHEHRVDYLDGAVCVYPKQIGTPSGLVAYSGEAGVFQKTQGKLAAFGRSLYVGEDVALASMAAMASVPLYHGALLGFLNGCALCSSQNVPLSAFAEIAIATLAVLDETVTDSTHRISTGSFDAQQTSIGTNAAAESLALATFREARVETALLVAFHRVFEKAVAAGYSSNDAAVMHNLFRLQ
jgi:3-hydroxyisobutyrate dehydrogenase-like beta-hydroxyacid dehydrogenase